MDERIDALTHTVSQLIQEIHRLRHGDSSSMSTVSQADADDDMLLGWN